MATNLYSQTSQEPKLALDADIATSAATLVSNSTSGHIYRIKTLKITNIDGVNDADVTVDIFRSAVAYKIAHNITVPAGSSLVLITSDDCIILENGDSLRVTASATGDLSAVCYYLDCS